MIQTIKLKQELKLINELSKMFYVSNEEDRESIFEGQDMCIVDPSTVIMLIAKTNDMKKIVQRFSNLHVVKRPTDLNYDEKLGDKISAKFSIDYLLQSIKLFNILEENPRLFLNSNYPITMIGEHFEIIIAPRQDGD